MHKLSISTSWCLQPAVQRDQFTKDLICHNAVHRDFIDLRFESIAAEKSDPKAALYLCRQRAASHWQRAWKDACGIQ